MLTDVCIESIPQYYTLHHYHIYFGGKKKGENESSHEVDQFSLFGYAESERINIVTLN